LNQKELTPVLSPNGASYTQSDNGFNINVKQFFCKLYTMFPTDY